MTVTSFNHRPTSCPPSTSTAPDRCHVPGHDKAARLGETPRRREKNATSEGKADDPGNRSPGRGRLGRREQPAHEPLILPATLVDVPLTGLFFGSHARGDATAESDVDLLVVESQPFGLGRSRRQELQRIRRALSRFPVPKDVLVYSRDEVDRWKDSQNHIIRKAYCEGKVLYGHE
jgi:uncharacterized protein